MEQEPLRHETLNLGTVFSGPGSLWDYIEDMLGELASLASANGASALATTITLAALEASRIERPEKES